MTRQSVFLLVTAAGLTPIALSYGLVPEKSLSVLFDIDADTTNIRHNFSRGDGALPGFDSVLGGRRAE